MKQFDPKILIIHNDIELNNAAGRSVRAIKNELIERGATVLIAYDDEDAQVIISSDPTIQCVLLNLDNDINDQHESIIKILNILRSRNLDLPVFLMADRTVASEIPTNILENINDFIWILDDVPEFVVGRIFTSIKRYNEIIQPPMFKALKEFSDSYEYSWHTPGHSGGTAFLTSAIGRSFYSFFGENLFRADLSISVGKLGSLLDHTGPIGESERYMARVFGSDRSYHVTNGSSASNRIILMASVTTDQVVLCDRNCHKSLEHALIMSGAIPNYLVPSRNHYGIIGPVKSEKLTPDNIQETLKNNFLINKDKNIDPKPVHAILTNSTYDGLCYNIKKVSKLLGQSVDRLHYDEAWFGYARFHPLYENFFGMFGDSKDYDRDGPSIFVTQSTHKLLAAFSQASMIHVRDGRKPIEHSRFNESFMMHSSTSPFYPIIASNDISCAMMDGPLGKSLIDDAIREAISFRKTIAKLNDEYKNKNDWFFNVWQPDFIKDAKDNKFIPFYEVSDDELATKSSYWALKSKDEWHGFGEIEEDYCMLDPLKVSITTPGVKLDGNLEDFGIPACIISAYLEERNIVVEKTTDFTILILFSIGTTKGKWGALLNALLEFKYDYDLNKPIETILPSIVQTHKNQYKNIGLRDLVNRMFNTMKELEITKKTKEAFAVLPTPDCSPLEAYEELVKGNVETFSLNEIDGKTVAAGIIPYPPGIPVLLSGEKIGDLNCSIIGYLKALETFDKQFPGFTHEIHGVEVENDEYKIVCIKNK